METNKNLEQKCVETGINFEYASQIKDKNPNSTDEQVINFCEQRKTFAENCLNS